MTLLCTFIFLIAMNFSASALEPVPQSLANDTQNRILDVKLGMTRQDVEKILGSDWKMSSGENWGHDRTAHYENKKMPGYEVKVGFQYSGHPPLGGIGIDDTVIELPVLRRAGS